MFLQFYVYPSLPLSCWITSEMGKHTRMEQQMMLIANTLSVVNANYIVLYLLQHVSSFVDPYLNILLQDLSEYCLDSG